MLSSQRKCLQHAIIQLKIALLASKNSFYDSTMIPLLYFPNEFLYAVFCPLFLPILAPIIAALKRLKREIIVTKTKKMIKIFYKINIYFYKFNAILYLLHFAKMVIHI